METWNESHVRRREIKKSCKIEHMLLCIGLMREQINVFNYNGIRSIQDMIQLRIEALNGLVGDEVYQIRDEQRNHLVDFRVWYEDWLSRRRRNILVDFLRGSWNTF